MQENNQLNPDPEENDIVEGEVFIDSFDNADLPGTSTDDSIGTLTADSAIDKQDEADLIIEEESIKPFDQDAPTPPRVETGVPESKTRQFFRKLFRWAAGVLIIFGVGLITGIFLLYRPATLEAERSMSLADSELTSAQGQIAELGVQISALEAQIDTLQPLKDANTALLAVQDGLILHIAILDVRIDVTSALLALSQEDNARAQVLLDNTTDTLNQISTLLEPAQRDIATAMIQRLDLVLSEIEDDPYAAISDLDVLRTNLLQLEDALITE